MKQKNIIVKEFDYNLVDDNKTDEECLVDQCIIDIWHRERDNHHWLYNKDEETDCFIEISVQSLGCTHEVGVFFHNGYSIILARWCIRC